MEDIRRVHAGILEPIAFFFVHHRWCARAYRQSSFSSAMVVHLCPPAMVVQCLLRAHPPHVMVTLSANCTRHDHGVALVPLSFADMDRTWSETIHCYDASLVGYGVASAQADPREVGWQVAAVNEFVFDMEEHLHRGKDQSCDSLWWTRRCRFQRSPAWSAWMSWRRGGTPALLRSRRILLKIFLGRRCMEVSGREKVVRSTISRVTPDLGPSDTLPGTSSFIPNGICS